MTYDKSFSDKKKVDITLQEYGIEKVTQEVKLKDGGYVGTVSQIYVMSNIIKDQFPFLQTSIHACDFIIFRKIV